MERVHPPVKASDKMLFWKNFLHVGHGLLTIHGEEENYNNVPQILLGWHQDINPWNILVKQRKGGSVYDCDFKLADLGLSHFKKHVPSARRPTDTDTWGTAAYGAPEARRANGNLERTRLQVRQDIDIWSLGCVYSEVAIWVDDGKNKLIEYRRRRSDEMHRITDVKEDCFHDGFDVLDVVHQAHRDIMQNRRVSDLLTGKVVEHLVCEMLQVKGNRPSAQEICHCSRWIVHEADRELKHNLTQPSSQYYGLRTPPEEDVTPGPSHARQMSNDSLRRTPSSIERRQRNSDSYYRRQPLQSNTFSPYNDGMSNNATEYSQQNFDPRHDSSDKYSTFSATRARGSSQSYQRPDTSGSHPYRVSDPPQSHRNDTLNAREQASPTTHRDLNTGSELERENALLIDHPFWTDNQSQSPPRIGIQPVDMGNEPSKTNSKASEMSGPNTSELIQDSDPPTTQTERHHQKQRNVMPLPELTIDQALAAIKRHQNTGQPLIYSSEKEDRMLFEPLLRRDQVILIDNSSSMHPYRDELRKLLGLLSDMLAPCDPDGIDLYFASEPTKYQPEDTVAALSIFDKQEFSALADLRHRFASILEGYQGAYGKRNVWKKMRNPLSTPSKGPRKIILYVLTDGAWWHNITLMDEVKSLVQHVKTNNIANKHIGIQFIRFGHDEAGIKNLENLDLKSKLGVTLDLVDTKPVGENVWKMLLGPLNPGIDDDVD